jgi:hypothetical protein
MKKTMGMVAAKMTLSWETWLEQQQQRQEMQRRAQQEVLLLQGLQAQSGRSLCVWMWQVR